MKHTCPDTLDIKSCSMCAWENYHDCDFWDDNKSCKCVPPRE